MPVFRFPSIASSALLATVLISIPFHLRPDNFIVDDGYFYPEIARFIAHGQGSTFNGIMATNGYHPLWMLVCVAVASFIPAASALIQWITAIQDALTLASFALLIAICRATGKRGVVLGFGPILLLSVVLGIWRLLEANLALTLQIAVLCILIKPIFPAIQLRLGSSRGFLIGLLLGLTLLARLDLLFFVATVWAYELIGRTTEASFASRVRSVMLQVAVAAIVILPYLKWNLSRFHHLTPISGAIKNTFPHIQHWHIGAFAIPVVFAAAFNLTLLIKRERTGFDEVCLITAVASSLHLAWTLSFGGLAPWYLTTGYLCVCLCIVRIVDLALADRQIPLWFAITWPSVMFGALLLLGCLRLYSNFSYTRLVQGNISFNKSYVEPKHALALQLRETLPPGSRIFIFDAPGGVAYASGMSLLPADGLVADYTYNTDVVREGFVQYALDRHIDYFIAPYLMPNQKFDRLSLKGEGSRAAQTMSVEAPLTHKDAGTITLSDVDLLFRAPEINPDLEGVFPEVGVWRIRH